MMKGEIASVVWHRQGHRIELNYDEGDPDILEGNELVVAGVQRTGEWQSFNSSSSTSMERSSRLGQRRTS